MAIVGDDVVTSTTIGDDVFTSVDDDEICRTLIAGSGSGVTLLNIAPEREAGCRRKPTNQSWRRMGRHLCMTKRS